MSLAYHYFALRAANEIEPFRYRLRDGQVIVHDVIHGGTTVLLPNEIFTLAYFEYDAQLRQNSLPGRSRCRKWCQETALSSPDPQGRQDSLHHLAVGFVHEFFSCTELGTRGSVPKIAFGKFVKVNERTLMPFSVEVHHALMDGLHVGRYVRRLEEALREPETSYPKNSSRLHHKMNGSG